MSLLQSFFSTSQTTAMPERLAARLDALARTLHELTQRLQPVAQSLADVQAAAQREQLAAEVARRHAVDAEQQALLQDQPGGPAAAQALAEKDHHAAEALRLTHEADRHRQMAELLRDNLQAYQAAIHRTAGELALLRARLDAAKATAAIDRHFSRINPTATLTLLQTLQRRQALQAALAEAGLDPAQAEARVAAELDAALAGG